MTSMSVCLALRVQRASLVGEDLVAPTVGMELDDILLGYRAGYGAEYPVALSVADRRQHCYVIGKTGVGKSTLLENLIIQDIEAGRGVGFIDPHGDSSLRLLDRIPSARIGDVIFFDPSDFATMPKGSSPATSSPPSRRPSGCATSLW